MKRTILSAMLLLAMVCHSEAQEPARGFHQGETFELCRPLPNDDDQDRKSTRLNSSHR